jgi:hypothetical protein
MVMFTMMIMMLVAVIMIVTAALAVMRMIVCAVIVLVRMIVRVIVTRRRLRIGAAFRIERRFDLDHACAKASYHIGDDVITPDAQPARHNLRR